MSDLRTIILLALMISFHSKSLSDQLICQLTTNGTEIKPRPSSSHDRLILSVDILWVEGLPNMTEKTFLSCSTYSFQMPLTFSLFFTCNFTYTIPCFAFFGRCHFAFDFGPYIAAISLVVPLLKHLTLISADISSLSNFSAMFDNCLISFPIFLFISLIRCDYSYIRRSISLDLLSNSDIPQFDNVFEFDSASIFVIRCMWLLDTSLAPIFSQDQNFQLKTFTLSPFAVAMFISDCAHCTSNCLHLDQLIKLYLVHPAPVAQLLSRVLFSFISRVHPFQFNFNFAISILPLSFDWSHSNF